MLSSISLALFACLDPCQWQNTEQILAMSKCYELIQFKRLRVYLLKCEHSNKISQRLLFVFQCYQLNSFLIRYTHQISVMLANSRCIKGDVLGYFHSRITVTVRELQWYCWKCRSFHMAQ